MPFRDVVGHARLIDLLTRSIAGGTLPPSLLFAGPAGIGKRLVALSVAQTLNCLRPRPSTHDSRLTTDDCRLTTDDRRLTTAIDACGVCPACARIARGVHPDVVVVTPDEKGSIRMEHVRDIVERSQYRPFEGRRRVVIIDEADKLVVPAQNALLKTLEEPTPSSVFILVTSRPDTLLPTVLSRCPQLRFRPLSAGDVAAVLMAREYPEVKARAVAAIADGSVGQALEASADDLVDARHLALRILEKAAESSESGSRFESAKHLHGKPSASGVENREQLAVHLRAMASLVRDVELLSTGSDDRALANADVRSAVERLTPAYRGERGVRAFAAIDRALEALTRNAGVKVVADWVVLQL